MALSLGGLGQDREQCGFYKPLRLEIFMLLWFRDECNYGSTVYGYPYSPCSPCSPCWVLPQSGQPIMLRHMSWPNSALGRARILNPDPWCVTGVHLEIQMWANFLLLTQSVLTQVRGGPSVCFGIAAGLDGPRWLWRTSKSHMTSWNNQLPAVSKQSLSLSKQVEYGAGLNWSTSCQLFQNLAWAVIFNWNPQKLVRASVKKFSPTRPKPNVLSSGGKGGGCAVQCDYEACLCQACSPALWIKGYSFFIRLFTRANAPRWHGGVMWQVDSTPDHILLMGNYVMDGFGLDLCCVKDKMVAWALSGHWDSRRHQSFASLYLQVIPPPNFQAQLEDTIIKLGAHLHPHQAHYTPHPCILYTSLKQGWEQLWWLTDALKPLCLNCNLMNPVV